MIRNYIKIAIRNIRTNKLYSLINIGGLSLGLSACILIMLYVSHEYSFDKFHLGSENIFTFEAKAVFGSDTIYMQRFSPSTAALIDERSPEVEEHLRMYSEYKPVIIKNPDKNASFSEAKFGYADANFFDFFSFKLLQGNPKTALSDPLSLVISKDVAIKYFGNQNPIGKTLEFKKDSIYQYHVTGVVENRPSNSSIDTRFIASLSSLEKMSETESMFKSQIVQGGAFETLVKLEKDAVVQNVVSTAEALSKEGYKEANDTYLMRPFIDKHHENSRSPGMNYLDVFPLIAGLVLLLALINYISLTTARATSRSTEIGIRKVNGANRKAIAVQFYLESTVYIAISFVVAGILCLLLKDRFFTMLDISIDSSFLLNPTFLLILIGIFVLSIIIAGLYPAIIMSAFKPVDNFKQQLQNDFGGNMVRKISTTLQFIIAVVLIIGGIIIQQQMNYIRNIDTGLDRSEILMIPISNSMVKNTSAFRTEVERIPGVKSTSLSNYPLYEGYDIYFASAKDTEDLSLPFMSVDNNFFDVLNVKWKIKPENLNIISQSKKVIINEKTIAKFGLDTDPIGQSISLGNTSLEIVGVVQDFNYASLSNPIDAMAIKVSEREAAANSYGSGCLYIKYDRSANLPMALGVIKEIFEKYDAETSFNYRFMDDAFTAMFKSEDRLANMFNLFVLLTIIIAGVGLFGLAMYSAQKRVKEIGIRKVLGASVFQITSLLSKDFIKLIAIAVLIAAPIAWYFAQNWLQNFAYRIEIKWWVFVLASGATFLIALLTVSFQAIKAAIANPVKSLRTE